MARSAVPLASSAAYGGAVTTPADARPSSAPFVVALLLTAVAGAVLVLLVPGRVAGDAGPVWLLATLALLVVGLGLLARRLRPARD